MKVLFLTIGDENVASSRTRVFQYLPYLRQRGVRASVFIRNPYMLKGSKSGAQRLFRSAVIRFRMAGFVLRALTFRIVFVQKAFLAKSLVTLLGLLGKRIVFDFDDAIYSTFDGRSPKDRKLKKLAHTLKNASLVVVENEANRAYAQALCPKVTIITGPIECNRYRPAPRPSAGRVVIGWIGSSNSSIYLAMLRAPFQALARRFPGQFGVLLVGVSQGPFEEVPVECRPWSLDTEVDLLGRFDVGVMPLFDDQWTQGKGGYKILQYMAMGIPVVASPAGINSLLVREGVDGFLAHDEAEWEERLATLLADQQLRSRMGANGRERAVREYSFEKYAGSLVQALEDIVRESPPGGRRFR
jgi:glycosyltransferase involved in cell wall biosynthesis